MFWKIWNQSCAIRTNNSNVHRPRSCTYFSYCVSGEMEELNHLSPTAILLPPPRIMAVFLLNKLLLSTRVSPASGLRPTHVTVNFLSLIDDEFIYDPTSWSLAWQHSSWLLSLIFFTNSLWPQNLDCRLSGGSVWFADCRLCYYKMLESLTATCCLIFSISPKVNSWQVRDNESSKCVCLKTNEVVICL